MSQHQTVFTIEKAIPAAEAAPTLPLPREFSDPTPEGAPQATEDASKHRRKRPLRTLLLIGASLLAVAGASNFGWRYWTVGRFEVSTDDAYVKADSTTIAPKVSGYLAAVLVGDNEPVKAGQILARIDDRDFKVAFEQAKADVTAAKASIANRQAALDAQQSADRGGQGHHRGRSGKRDVRRAGGQALRRARHQGLRQRPECPAGRLAHRRRPRHRRARHRSPRERNQAARRAPGRARTGTGGARPRRGGCSTRRS